MKNIHFNLKWKQSKLANNFIIDIYEYKAIKNTHWYINNGTYVVVPEISCFRKQNFSNHGMLWSQILNFLLRFYFSCLPIFYRKSNIYQVIQNSTLHKYGNECFV